jgi:cell volume regulation protein A
MRRVLALLAAALTLALFLLPSARAAVNPIPGTPVSVIDLGSTSKTVGFGVTTNLTWAVFNTGPPAYSMNVTANTSSPDILLSVFPSSFTIARDAALEVVVNVTTPPNGNPRTVVINVTFTTLAPVVSNRSLEATIVLVAEPGSPDVLTAFVAIGAIIAIGFTATLIFERTRVPDLLILIFLGVLLGPIALEYFGISFVPAGVLELATPYFTAIALMIILFDGGLNLPIVQVVRRIGAIGLQTGASFTLTLFAIGFVTSWVLGWPLLVGFLLGAILAGTSSAVVIGLVRALKVSEETKVILTLESVLTDVLCVVTVIAIIELLRGGEGASVTIVFAELSQAFAVATAFGLFFGVGWLVLLRRIERKPFAYMLTIAILFILYGFSEASGGSGAMAAFVFGLVLGNHVEFAKRMNMQARFVVDDRIKQFHSELSFVIRTFFFVFLGLSFAFRFGGAWTVSTSLPLLSAYNGTFTLFFAGVFAVFLTIVVVRVITARITAAVVGASPGERRVMWSIMGRGLAAAVLAALPFTIAPYTSPTSPGDVYYQGLLAPYHAQFLNIAFYVILFTVGATTLGVATFGRGTAGPAPVPSEIHGVGSLRQWDLEDLEILEEPPPPD